MQGHGVRAVTQSLIGVGVCFPHVQVVVCNIISLVLQAPLYTLMLVLYARYDIDDPRLEGDAEHGTDWGPRLWFRD